MFVAIMSWINRRFQTIPGHVWYLIVTSCFVLAYAIWILAYIWHIPEIGVHCTLRNVVTRLDPALVQADRNLESLIGWHVVRLGHEQIETWPQFVRAIQDLGDLTNSPLAISNRLVRRDADGHYRTKIELSNDGQTAEITCQIGQVSPQVVLPWVLWIVFQMGLFFVGLLVYAKRPHDAGARMFYVLSMVAIGAYMAGYHWVRICTQPVLTTIYIVCAVMLPSVHLHFFLTYPTPKPLTRLRPGLTWLAVYGLPTLFAALILTGYTAVRWLSRSGGSADEINMTIGWLRNVIFLYFGIAALWYVASIVALLHSYRRARNPIERNQIRWILGGSLLALVPYSYALYLANRHPGELASGAAIWPLFAASACFTFAFAVGITRYRLLQFDQIMGSGLAYVFVSGLAALIYCALVVIGMLLFGARGPTLEQAAWVGGSALVLSISLDAARVRLRNYLDRRFRKDKTQLDSLLSKFGEAVDQLVDTPTLARRLLQICTDIYGYPLGAVYIRVGSGAYELAGTLGVGPVPPLLPEDSALVAGLRDKPLFDRLALPPMHPVRKELAHARGDVAVGLMHEGQLIGLMTLARAPGRPAGPDDSRLIASFAPIAAMALAGAEVRQGVGDLNRELQAKVEKISEQQRRIFSLQQQLIAQSRRAPVAATDVELAPTTAKNNSALETLVGSSSALQTVLDVIPKVAANTSAVLIRGESGTGKELLAKALHDLSPRASGPFVKVHCAALAPGVLESELFGHVKGAFTGALKDKPGRFETANHGTLFLDEIGDISLDLQTKLLRVLQEKTFERVGSNEQMQVDVRLITATHQNLERLIREGRFRADLFYRLNVIALNMPALRERGEDVIELAQHFLRKHSNRCRKAIDAIDDETLLALRDYHWPGNIRELENVIERAVVIADGPVVALTDLPAEVLTPRTTPMAATSIDDLAAASHSVARARQARHSREKAEILQALNDTDWNRTEAARRLGLARSTLLSRMKKYDIGESQSVG